MKQTISCLSNICISKASRQQGVRDLCAGIPACGEIWSSSLLLCRRDQREIKGGSSVPLSHSHRSSFRLMLNWSLAVEPGVCY